MKVTCEVKGYDETTSENRPVSIIIIKSYSNHNRKVVICVDDHEYTFLATDLQKAINNATNS